MSVTALMISNVPLKQQTSQFKSKRKNMANSLNKNDNGDLPQIKLSLPKDEGLVKRRLSSSEIDLNRCLEEAGETEPLLKQYVCAWNKDGSFLIQGHLYITPNYICFYSNILSWETKLVIKCREVISIFKQRTAFVFPNAISIATLQHEYFFTSFIHRNSAYKALICTWKSCMKGITLSRPDLINMIKNKKYKEDESHLSSGEETSDVSQSVHELTATDDDQSTQDIEYSNSYETDSCLPSSQFLTTSEDDNETDGRTHKMERSNSLISLVDFSGGNIIDTEETTKADVDETNGGLWNYLTRPLVSYADLINIIFVILIICLVISMAILICKLSELDPTLRPWLSWQPWCRIICKYS